MPRKRHTPEQVVGAPGEASMLSALEPRVPIRSMHLVIMDLINASPEFGCRAH
jgi:hypothetical protein